MKQQWIEMRGDDGKNVYQNLPQKYRRYTEGKVKWKLGGSFHVELPFYAVLMPRVGCKVFVDLHAVYHFFGMTSYNGWPSKWVYQSRASWEAFCVKLCFGEGPRARLMAVNAASSWSSANS